MKKSLRNFAAIIGLGLSSFMSTSEAQEREVRVEGFRGQINREYVAEPADHWVITPDNLEARDFEDQSGYLRFLFLDKEYSYLENLSLNVDFRKSGWGSDADRGGIVFAGSPTNNTYYQFVINADPNSSISQFNISRQSPGLNYSYVNKEDNINIVKGGVNKLIVSYDAQGWHFKINNADVLTSLEYSIVNSSIPSLEGYVGMVVFDSMGENDPMFSSTTYFNNFIVSYDRVKCEDFIRGDSNSDGTVNISDPLYTLRWLFLGGPRPICADAADANTDERVDISDPIYTLHSLFRDDRG